MTVVIAATSLQLAAQVHMCSRRGVQVGSCAAQCCTCDVDTPVSVVLPSPACPSPLPAAVPVASCRDKVFLEHIFSSTAILSYILFWMIFYNVCHVF